MVVVRVATIGFCVAVVVLVVVVVVVALGVVALGGCDGWGFLEGWEVEEIGREGAMKMKVRLLSPWPSSEVVFGVKMGLQMESKMLQN